MQPTKSVSKVRVVLTWVLIVLFILVIGCFSFWHGYTMAPGHAHGPQTPTDDSGMPAADFGIINAIALFMVGLFFFVPSLAAYFILVYSCFLTFNFRHPVWQSMKAKTYIFNIFVAVGLSLGIGFIVAGFLGPLLAQLGLPRKQADLLPVLVVLIGFQLLRLWILIWAPSEKLLIARRLEAMGVTREQLKGAMLVGISNPGSGMVKRFGAIEEDMGALWVLPDRLAFRMDEEQFDLTREQIAGIDRSADNRSTTALAGIAHVVLEVRLLEGGTRRMRLHTEGQWTLGEKRRAMDALAHAIEGWLAGQRVLTDETPSVED